MHHLLETSRALNILLLVVTFDLFKIQAGARSAPAKIIAFWLGAKAKSLGIPK